MSLSDRNELAHGIYAELATPRRAGLAEADTAALLDYVDTVARARVDGLVFFGAAGEFVHFDLNDRMHAVKMAIRRSRVPVLVNASHSTLDGAIALADDAIGSGAAGVLLLPPYLYRYGEADIEEFYLRFRREVPRDVPVYLYNLPFCGNEISEALAQRLLATGEFAGINDASGDWNSFESLVRVNAKIQLLVGNERLYLNARKHGAAGCVSGVAAVVPELMVALDRALQKQPEDRAILLNGFLHEFTDRLERLPPAAGIATAAAARGWKFNNAAVPLSPASRAEQDKFCGWLRDWLPAVLKECARA